MKLGLIYESDGRRRERRPHARLSINPVAHSAKSMKASKQAIRLGGWVHEADIQVFMKKSVLAVIYF